MRVTPPSTIQGNTAIEGRGGGVAYDDDNGKNDGGVSCVRLSLFVEIDGDKNVDATGVELATDAKDTLLIYTTPNSPLSSLNEREEVKNQATTWCVPCGKYELIAGTGHPNAYLPKQCTSDDDLLLVNNTHVRTNGTTSTFAFSVPSKPSRLPTHASKLIMLLLTVVPSQRPTVTRTHSLI